MKILRLAAWTVWFMLAWTAIAAAEPVTAAVAAIATILAKGGVAAMLIKAAFGIALTVASTLLQRAMMRRQRPPGITGQLQVGGNNSVSFVVGHYATAGSLEYTGEWGKDGKTPNAYHVQVITLSDLPQPGIRNRIWINGQQCEIDFNATPTEMGYPVKEYRIEKGNKDHMWVKVLSGAQTTSDLYLRSKFGSHDDKPWLNDMIGRGLTVVVLTALINRELLTQIPMGRFEPNALPLYDLRKDSTAGGSGSHRWGVPSTYEPTDNPAVIIYNILRGIWYEGELLYGPAIPATRLPFDSWVAAMNECDVPVDGEPQFRFGYEIMVAEDEPIEVIREALKACNGKIAETGGVYKIHVGPPGLPVYFITDEDFVVTDEQEFDPFPGLEATINGATAHYPEPTAGWEIKDAPQRRFPDLEAEDDDRILLTDFQFNGVPFPTQVQRLMKSLVLDNRRFRKHRGTLPPSAFVLEPLDVISWSSAREGYVDKLFGIDAMDDMVNANQGVAIRETDPSDFDWNFATDALPWSVGPLVPHWPVAQPITGWQVLPAEYQDREGRSRRPSIEVRCDGDLDDVRAVRVVVRLAEDQSIVFDAEVPYGDPGDDDSFKSFVLNGVFLPDEDYEVQGRLVPFSSRETEESEWLPVTTPDIRFGDFDVFLPGMVEDIENWFLEMSDWLDSDSPFHPLWQDIEGLDEKVGVIQSDLNGILGAEEYDPAEAYLEGSLVQFDGGLYRAVQNVPAGTPPTNADFWEKIGDYASLGDAVVALTARVGEAESEIARTADGFRSTTHDSRRIYNAAMVSALLEIDKAGEAAFEATDQFKATAAVGQWAETEISRVDGVLTVHAGDITRVQAELAGKAALSVTQALQVQITQQGEDIASQGGLITAVENNLGNLSADLTNNYYTKTQTDGVASTAASSATTALSSTLSPQIAAADGKANTALGALGTYTAANAVAAAFSALDTSVSSINNQASAQATRTDDLFVALGGSTNQVRVKYEALSGPSGYSRLGIVGRTTGFADRAASAFMDVPNNAALPTRWAFQSDQFAILDGNGNLNALFDGNTAYLNNARVRHLTGDQMLVNGVHANVLQAGTLDASKWAPPAAGDNIIFEFLGGYEVASIFTDWPDVTHYPSFLGVTPGQGRIFGCNSRFAGSVRLRLFHYADNDGSPVSISSIVRVYRNGSQIQEWTTAALKGSPQHRVLNIAVSVGDNISVAHAKTSGQGVSVVGGVTIGSANITPAIY